MAGALILLTSVSLVDLAQVVGGNGMWRLLIGMKYEIQTFLNVGVKDHII